MPSGFPKPDKGLTPRFISVHYSNANARPGPHGAGGWQGDTAAGAGPPQAVRQAQMPGPSLASTTPFDTIKQTVLRIKGKIFVIQTPMDLAKAVGEIDRGK